MIHSKKNKTLIISGLSQFVAPCVFEVDVSSVPWQIVSRLVLWRIKKGIFFVCVCKVKNVTHNYVYCAAEYNINDVRHAYEQWLWL